MTNPTPEARAELARVVELLDEASPGPLMVQDDNEGELRPLWAVYNADFGNDTEDGAPLQAVIHYGRKQDAEAIAAAVNFLRKHGASLLSSHGGGGEAGITAKAVVAAESALIAKWNLHKPDAHRMAVDAIAAALPHLTPPPQPRDEGMVLAGLVGACCLLLADPSEPAYIENLREALDEAQEALAAAPGEGGGECETCNGYGMIGGPSFREPDEGGVPCPDCATPPPASQSATPSEVNSRSRIRRIAAEKGEPWPRSDGPDFALIARMLNDLITKSSGYGYESRSEYSVDAICEQIAALEAADAHEARTVNRTPADELPHGLEWRWVDDAGRAMTNWSTAAPPPVLDLSDAKGAMHVEVRAANGGRP